jgi:acetoin utilization deacetylase AcuC-like enzyme
MPAGSDDADYRAIFEGILAEDLERFRPQMVLVSAGFDAHQGDPLAGMWLTSSGFGALCREVRRQAQRWSEDRLALLLEGGYRLDTLGACVRACWEEL